MPAPSHWPRTRVKYVCRFAGGGTPDKGNIEYWNGEIPWVSPKDMKSSDVADTEDHITKAGLDSSAAKLVEPGAVLIVMRSGILRHSIPVAINRVPVTLNQDMRSLIPASILDPSYLARLIEGHQHQLLNVWSKEGTTVESLESDLVADTEIAMPPLLEQRAIADYLDRETARLDGLVAAKERALGLLAEKRRALITRAVTRGLDPRAPLRDSGIPWLGEIPAHWDALRLKHLLKAQKGSIKTGPFGSQLHLSEMQEGQIKVYNQKTVIDRDIAGGDDYISKQKFDELRSFEVFPGDLLVTTRGTIGRCMVVPEQAGRGILHPCLMRIQLADNRALNDYIEMLIEDSGQVLDQLRIVSNATTIDVIYSESLKEVWLAVPPIPEQRAIVAHIAAETAKLDALRSATERTIALLKERRTALIAAAVTGRLDVQGAGCHIAVVAD
jgi:type I restriction enzyme S subunit